MRKILAVVFLLFFAASASAAVYGTFPSDLEKQSDGLSTEIGVGIVNAGDQPLLVEFSFPESNDYNVSGSRTVELQPSGVTEDPEGESWKYLGNGKYARIQSFDFEVEISEYRDSNRIDVPMTVEASPLDSGGGGARSPVSQVNEYNYTVLLAPRLRPLERETDREVELDWGETDQEELPDDWTDSDTGEGNETGDLNSSGQESYKSNRSESSDGEGESEGADTVTMILLAGILVTASYMLGVV